MTKFKAVHNLEHCYIFQL